MITPGFSISVDWWYPWLHWHISFSWEGLSIWHSPCKSLSTNSFFT